MDFIQNLLRHTSMYESSTAFWKWGGYATIAAILRDNMYLQQGDGKLFPNIYVLLLADSGIHRKGNPVRLSQEMVEEIGTTKTIAGRTSVQAIFEEMMGGETNSVTGKMVKGGSLTFFAEELAAGIVSDEQSVGILTDIYDFKKNYKLNLVSKGRRKVEQMVFTLFAGSNETLLRDVYTSSAIRGGLLARTFLVTPDEFRDSKVLYNTGDTSSSMRRVIDDLRLISEMKGPFKLSKEADETYRNWYVPFRNGQRNKVDKTGVTGRIQTGILKLAMILAANQLREVISEKDINVAIDECMRLLPNYNSFAVTQGKATVKDAGAIVLQELINEPGYTMERRIILRKHWMDFDVDVLDKLVQSLTEAGLLTSGMVGKETVYTLTNKCLEIMK